MMGATGSASAQRDSKCEEDEELQSGQEEITESSSEDKLLQKNCQISGLNEKPENQTDEMTSQSEERDLVDVGSGFVTLEEDASDTTSSILNDVSQTSTDNFSSQKDKTDDIIAKEENQANNKVYDTETGFKKIFRFAGFKFTVKKDKVEKSDVDELVEHEQDINAAGPSVDCSDTTDVNSVSTKEQDVKEITNERIGGDVSVEFPETQSEIAAGKISAHTTAREEHSAEKGLMKNIPQSPEPKEPMSPIKQFFSQGILASLRKKKKEGETQKGNEEELKDLDKVVEKETTKEDTTCTCLDVSNGSFDGDKDIQMYKKDEDRPAAEGDVMNSLEQDKVQASPFKRLFRKLSLRRQSETKPGDTNLLEPGENINGENPQLSTELFHSEQEQETKVAETQPADDMKDTSHEESKRKSDSSVSWENLICVRSAKTRVRKTSDSEDETQDKGEMLRRTNESPLESSTEGDHLTSSNEQGRSPAEEESGSTWKSFKKLVTPKRKSRTEESGSADEQMQSDTEITKDESSCSLRKLISGRKKKIKPDGQQENMSSDEGSKDTGTDIEDDETPGVVPLSEYERAEPKVFNVMTDVTIESEKEKEIQPIIEEDKPKQIQPSINLKPKCFDAEQLGVPIPTEYMEELTEFLSKHQQLSDIPEEGIIEESIATPASFVEWTTQDDTLDDDIVDMTADAVTAPEHASEDNEDETTEMVSAVSQLSESPKTSGNATPISPVYDMRESDIIFQDAVESICMVPSMSITTVDNVPEPMAVSTSQFIVESTTKTERKLLVAHKKGEATSICIGIVSQEIRGAEVVLPLPLVEGISEVTHAVPAEFISEDLAEVSEGAGIVADNVYEAEIQEMKTMLHEMLSHNEQSTILAETVRKSEQQIIMVKNIQEDVPVVLMEDVVNNSTELLNGIHEFTPVHAAVHDGTQLLEEQIITLNMNRPDTEGPLHPALEEPVCEQLTQSSKIPVEVEKEITVPNAESSAADVKQFDLVSVTGPVVHSAVESVPDNSLNEVSKSIEDVVQFTEVAESVMYSLVGSESDPAVYQASEIIEDMTVLVSDEKCSDTTAPVGSVIPILDTVNIEMDLAHEVQIKNDHSLHFVDSHAIQVKEDITESQTENIIAMTVLTLGTTSGVADGNIEMTEEGEKAKQNIEPKSAEMMEETVDEKIVNNFEAKNLSEIINKPTKETEGKESELNTFGDECTLPVATTNEENAIEKAEDMSKVMLEVEKDTILVEDCKRNQTAGDEIHVLTLDTIKTGEETKTSPAIFAQQRDYEEVAQNTIQPPTTDNSKPVSQPTFSKLTPDTLTTAVVRMSKEADSAKSEEVKRTGVEDESDKLLASKQEQNKKALDEAVPEIITEQETVEKVEPFPKAEPRIDSDVPQTDILSSKPEQSQATESCHKPYEENNQATEAIIKMSETVSFIFNEKTGVECNTSDQPVATIQCINGIDRVSLLEEVKIPLVDGQSVMSDTCLVEKQEDNETSKPEVNTEINKKRQEAEETVKTSLKVEPQRDTEHLQKEILLIKQEKSHEPHEENYQVTDTAEITETISSVVCEQETRVECKIFNQPVETGQCIISVQKEISIKPEKSHEPYEENDHVSDTADITEPISSVVCEEEKRMECKISNQPVETEQCIISVQKEILSLKQEESHEPHEENDQVTDTADITEPFTSVVCEEETKVECEISNQPVETEQCIISVQKEISIKPEESHEPYEENDHVTVTAEITEPISSVVCEQETRVECKIFSQPVETEQCIISEQKEILCIKPEESHESHEENDQVTDTAEVTESIPPVVCEEETKVECKIVSQPVETEQCIISVQKGISIKPEESHEPYEENDHITVTAEITEPIPPVVCEEETRVECKIFDQPVETGQCIISVQKEILCIKPEESHEPHEENDQVTDTADITEPISSVVCEKETKVECKIFSQSVETGQCIRSVKKELSIKPEESHEPSGENDHVTVTAEITEPISPVVCEEETRAECKIFNQPVETGQCIISVQKEISIKPEESHEPYEENDQVTDTADITEPISSVVCEEETKVECKIVSQPVETGQCIISVQKEILCIKPEESHEPHEENDQVTDTADITESIPPVVCEEETKVECKIVSQPVETGQCIISVQKEISIKPEESHEPSEENDHVTVTAEITEPILPVVYEEETRAECKIFDQPIETGLCIISVQKEIFLMNPEESYESHEENDQVSDTTDITEPISSVVCEEETRVECKIFSQPVETGQCIKRVDEVPVSTMEHTTEILSKDKAKCLEGLIMSETEGSEHVMEVIKASTYQASVEVVSEHKAEMTVDSEENIVFADVSEKEIISKIDTANTAVTEKNIELTSELKLIGETTMTISDRRTVVTADVVEESLVVTENKPESEVLTEVTSELEAETMEVTESKADIIVVSEVQTETPVITSVVSELEVEIPVATTAEKPVNIEAFALTSAISKIQADLKPIIEPEVSAGTILQESPVVVSGIQTETDVSFVQTADLSPILKTVSEKENVIVNRPVVAIEPKLEMPMVTEVISAIPAMEVQTIENLALKTKTIVITCADKNVEAQGSSVTSVKEDTEVGTLVSTTTVTEAQFKTVTPVEQMLGELTATDLPEIQKQIDGQLIQETEIIETKPKTPDAGNGYVLRMTETKETRVEALRLTEHIIQEAILTSKSEDVSVKEDMGLSVLALITEEPTVASCIKLPTPPVAPVVYTPTIVPEEAQKVTVIPMVETLAETHCDAQVAVQTKAEQPPLTGIEVKVTEIIEQVTQDVENTANPKEDSKSLEERSGKEEVSVLMVKSLQGADDDVWEDAVDDISDQSYSSETCDILPDITICHADN